MTSAKLAFNHHLSSRLASLPLSPDARQQFDTQQTKLAAAEIPADLNDGVKDKLSQSLDESFVAGFRLVMYVCAGLALLSGLSAWVMIEDKKAIRSAVLNST